MVVVVVVSGGGRSGGGGRGGGVRVRVPVVILMTVAYGPPKKSHGHQNQSLTPRALRPSSNHKASPADGSRGQGPCAARAQITKPQLVVSEDLPWAA